MPRFFSSNIPRGRLSLLRRGQRPQFLNLLFFAKLLHLLGVLFQDRLLARLNTIKHGSEISIIDAAIMRQLIERIERVRIALDNQRTIFANRDIPTKNTKLWEKVVTLIRDFFHLVPMRHLETGKALARDRMLLKKFDGRGQRQ